MGINVNYNPAAGTVAQAGYTAGYGDYWRWYNQQQQQRDLQSQSIANQQTMQSRDQTFNAGQNDANRSQQQYLAQYDLYGNLVRGQQNAIYTGQLNDQQNSATMDRTRLTLAAQRAGEMERVQAEAARQQQQLMAGERMAQFQHGSSMMQNAQQGMIQGGLAQQRYGQSLGLNQQDADLRGGLANQQFGQQRQLQQDQFGQQSLIQQNQQRFSAGQSETDWQRNNFLGPYADQVDPYVQARMRLQGSEIQGKMQQLQQWAKTSGFEGTDEYQNAVNDLNRQYLGIKTQLPDEQDRREQEFQKNIFTAKVGGRDVQVYNNGGQFEILEDPKMRHDVTMAKERMQYEQHVQTSMRSAFMDYMSNWQKNPLNSTKSIDDALKDWQKLSPILAGGSADPQIQALPFGGGGITGF